MPANTLERLTFEQLAAELAYNNRTIARALLAQAEETDSPETADAAQKIIELYRKVESTSAAGGQENLVEAQITELLGRYDAWRFTFAELVVPIAMKLKHPAPATTIERTFERTPNAETPDAKPAKAPRPPRRAWTQLDIVRLTQAYLQATANLAEGAEPSEAHTRAAQAFQKNIRPDFTLDEVIGKAVELELMPPPIVEKPYELTDADKTAISARVRALCAGILPNNVEVPQTALTFMKFAESELREFIKELKG